MYNFWKNILEKSLLISSFVFLFGFEFLVFNCIGLNDDNMKKVNTDLIMIRVFICIIIMIGVKIYNTKHKKES